MIDKHVLHFFVKEAARQQKESDSEDSNNMRRNLAIGGGLLSLAGLGFGARKYLRKTTDAVPVASNPVRPVVNTVQDIPTVNPRVDYRDHLHRVGKDMGLDEDEFYEHFEDLDQIYDGDMAVHGYDLPNYLKSKGVDPNDFVNRFVPSWNKHFPDSHQLEEFTSPIGSPVNIERAYTPGGEDIIGYPEIIETVHPGIQRVADKFPFFSEGVKIK